MSPTTGNGTHVNVFVYGSLLPGLANYRLIKGRHTGAIPARLAGAVMYDLGNFPGLVRVRRPDATDAVGVVLTGIDPADLVSLDRLEGYRGPGDRSNFYNREAVVVLTEAGPVEAWVYTLARPKDYSDRCPVVRDGDWRRYYEDRFAGKPAWMEEAEEEEAEPVF